jgi:hypothetical protein
MARLRIAVPLLAALIALGVARARAQEPSPPPDVDTARASEKHAIEAGSEELFGQMLGKGEALPGGCKLTDGSIQRTSVLATYGCGEAEVVLELMHPEDAPTGAVRTERFAVTVKSGTAPGGLVEAIADKIRAGEAKFAWTDVGSTGERPAVRGTRWLVGLVVVVAAWLVFRSLRRRTPSADRA